MKTEREEKGHMRKRNLLGLLLSAALVLTSIPMPVVVAQEMDSQPAAKKELDALLRET